MFFKRFSNSRIYLDYASSTPIDRAMMRSFSSISKSVAHANPSALHREGVALKKVLSGARRIAATAIGAQPDEIIFTGSATESDNLALAGSITQALKHGIVPSDIMVYTSPFEHSAIAEAVVHLNPGILVATLPQSRGVVEIKGMLVAEHIKLLLVTVVMVQNEIGALQPIKEIAKAVRKIRKDRPDLMVLFHTDATQAPLYYDLRVTTLGIDMMTLGATKLYCPKGVGMLYKRRGIGLAPLYYGGGQEMGLRPGTPAVQLIHDFAHALAYACKNRDGAVQKTLELRNYFESQVKKNLPQVRIYSSVERAPHISYLTIPDIDSELLVIELDARGIAVSSKSACKNEEDEESNILQFLYPGETLSAVRISYGRMTTKRELDKAIAALQSVLKKYQK